MMRDRKQYNVSHQKGAVSLFVVIFTALLVTTITVSFLQLMTRDQQQATYSDLSESAYDSALAGVEDAKRALLALRECGGSDAERCIDIQEAIDSQECSTLSNILGGGQDETLIQQEQSSSDRRLDQAYTCVKITSDTDDYLGSFDSASMATLVPLRGVSDFDRVRISWHQSEGGGAVDLPNYNPDGFDLPPVGEAWPEDRPAILRTQLINGGGRSSFSLSDFDDSEYSNTLFLAPSSTGIDNFSFKGDDARRSGSAAPQMARCQSSVVSGGYACRSTVLLLSDHEDDQGRRVSSSIDTVFLNLVAFYNATDYKIELMNGSEVVSFRGVQPEVDSTGRANDLFRRVVSRVEMGNTFNYPVAALETSGNLCKDFRVTTSTTDYLNNCEP